MIDFRLHDHSNLRCQWRSASVVAAVICALGSISMSSGEDTVEHPGEFIATFAPAPVPESAFTQLKTNSPFLRSLDLSKSLVLTGIARIDGNFVATLFEGQTKKTHIVTPVANDRGWRMVGVDGDQTDLKTVTAQIAMTGGEVFTVRYAEQQLQPPPKNRQGSSAGKTSSSGSRSSNYREGISGDGFRGPPPPEMIEKLDKLSDSQRNVIIQKMGELRDRGISSEERRGIFVKMVEGAAQGRR